MLCLKKESAVCLLIITSLFFSTTLAFAETATVSWDANTESDLSGYKIYYGTSSGSYDDVVDVGNTTSFSINNLVVGTTYFFVVTAFDFSGNESGFSNEVSFTPTQGTPPQITGVSVGDDTKLDVLFSEPLDKASAENPANYSIDGGVQVLTAALDADSITVHLTTSQHTKGQDYVISVSNVKDVDGNPIASGSTQNYNVPADSNVDTTAPQLVSVNYRGATQIDLNFSEPLDKASAEIVNNYSISPNIQVIVAALDQNLTRVHLVTSEHQDGVDYTLSVNNIYDRAGNPIASGSTQNYNVPADSNVDTTAPQLVSVNYRGSTQI
ncbi:Ig-like domain-containing protein, partial [candidate division KSB1 bacterium]|nr:Ig-like domain-containing protein [candidate division KSB1 bacterium]